MPSGKWGTDPSPLVPHQAEHAMSVHYEPGRDRYVVRWREGGRNRSQRFGGIEEAEAFDRGLRVPTMLTPVPVDTRSGGDGIYAYDTKAGVRFRFVLRQSDGSLSSRRGFTTRRAAATAQRRLLESIERGEVKVARQTFGEFWTRFLDERRPYLMTGSMVDSRPMDGSDCCRRSAQRQSHDLMREPSGGGWPPW